MTHPITQIQRMFRKPSVGYSLFARKECDGEVKRSVVKKRSLALLKTVFTVPLTRNQKVGYGIGCFCVVSLCKAMQHSSDVFLLKRRAFLLWSISHSQKGCHAYRACCSPPSYHSEHHGLRFGSGLEGSAAADEQFSETNFT